MRFMTALMRLGGLAAIVSALLAFLSLVLYLVIVGGSRISEAATSAAFYLPSGAQLLAIALLLLGLVTLFARQAEVFGALGLTGFVLALLGTVLAAGAAWSQVFVVPHLAEVAPAVADQGAGSVLAGFMLSYLLFGVGWLLFGVATLRTRTFPRWAIILLIVGAAIAILPLPSRALIVQLAVGYLGLTLLGGRAASDQQPSRVS
jgi:hypothetical protein